jgi:hypothetical protein
MQAAILAALARLLLEGAPVGEADRVWLQRRCEAGDWILGDEVRIREMLPTALRSYLTQFPHEGGPYAG